MDRIKARFVLGAIFFMPLLLTACEHSHIHM